MIIISAFLTCLVALIILRPLSIKFNLVDYPTERKDHSGKIPLIGGICVFFGVLIPVFFIIESNEFTIMLLITSSLILIQGVWDDFTNLQAKSKMAFQVLLTAIMIYITDVKLETFGHLFGISLPIELGVLSIPITLIAVVGLTNAINMIDGLDGLAASLSLVAIIGLLCFNLKSESSSFTNIIFAVGAALLPFLIFNISSSSKMKVFLGDGGSLFLGYIISWGLIYSAENTINFNPSFALWCVAIPLFDFFTVIIIRIFKKRSLIIADKDHIHHFLQNLGFSKKIILLILAFFGMFILLIGKLIEDNIPFLSFAVFLTLFLIYLYLRLSNVITKKIIYK